MYVTVNTLLTGASILGALSAFVTLFWKLFKWINHQKEQDEKIKQLETKISDIKTKHEKELKNLREEMEQKIDNLRDKHKEDTTTIQEEQTLVIYGLLACLKGLQAQGCNGAVTEAIDRIDKHINKRAHEQ